MVIKGAVFLGILLLLVGCMNLNSGDELREISRTPSPDKGADIVQCELEKWAGKRGEQLIFIVGHGQKAPSEDISNAILYGSGIFNGKNMGASAVFTDATSARLTIDKGLIKSYQNEMTVGGKAYRFQLIQKNYPSVQ